MTLPFLVRRAKPEDVFEVHRIHSTAIRDGAAGHYQPEVVEVWVDAFNPDNFPRNIERLEFWVAELDDGRLGGFLAVNMETAEVDSVYVAPWGKGMGMGSFLLGFAEERGRRAGLQKAWLDSSLNAMSFYAGFGWKEIKRHARTRNSVEIPVVRMEKSLAP